MSVHQIQFEERIHRYTVDGRFIPSVTQVLEAAGKKYAQLNFLIGYLVAQDINKPTWNPGDIFAAK